MRSSQLSAAATSFVAFTALDLPRCAMAGGGGGPNPFTFEYYMLDNWQFWLVFFLMLFYGLVIDRLQFLAALSVENDRCSQKIYDRSIAEFMVFGIVAVTLFLIPYLADLPQKIADKLTYCDLLVSFSACFLILLGVVYNSLMKSVKSHLEKNDDFEDDDLKGAPMLGWTPMGPAMQQHFMTLHGLSKNRFSWFLYFQEALTCSICNLIDINWITWVVACILVSPMVLIKHEFPVDKASGWVYGPDNMPCSETDGSFIHYGISSSSSSGSSSSSDISRRLGGPANGAYAYLNGCHFDYDSEYASQYQIGWLIATWSSVLATVFTYVFTRLMRQKLYSLLSEQSEDDVRETMEGSDTILKAERERMAWWCPHLQQILQVEGLVMTFFLGMFVMHIRGAWWWLYMIAFLVGLLIIQPLAILELSSVQAFVVTDHELLDSISQQVIQVILDLKHVRHQLEEHPEAIEGFIKANGGDRITKKSLQADLAAIHVYVSASRANAIFDYLDTETYDDDKGTSDSESGDNLEQAQAVLYDKLVEHTISVHTLMEAVFESKYKRA